VTSAQCWCDEQDAELLSFGILLEIRASKSNLLECFPDKYAAAAVVARIITWKGALFRLATPQAPLCALQCCCCMEPEPTFEDGGSGY
jgi:hypothetical protein